MKSASVVFAIATLSLTLVVGGTVPAKASTFDDYQKDCIQRARQQGLTQDVAVDVCNCTIKKFRSLYSLPQFQAIVKKSKTDKVTARKLSEVGEACFDAILYEN